MTKNAGSTDASSISLCLQDRFGEPIKGLKIEIHGMKEEASHVLHTMLTDAQGLIQFAVKKGDEVEIHVKRWADESMKKIAKLRAEAASLNVRLISPKTRHKLKTQLDVRGEGGYRRGTYVVRKGDTLTSIARRYHTSVDLLKHANGLGSDLIKEEQILKVPPVEDRASENPRPSRPASARSNTPASNESSVQPTTQAENARGRPTQGAQQATPPIIFPLRKRPLNDKLGSYGEGNGDYTWNKGLGDGGSLAPRYGSSRSGGKRLHAGRDLYVEKYAEIVAIAPGVVLRCAPFYSQTDQITIHHTTSDGRQYIVRYGEVDPGSILVRVGDRVEQGQLIAKSGVLINANGSLMIVAKGKNVSMLHFETYSGNLGYTNEPALTDSRANRFQRRSDLIDPLSILEEGYRATFLDAPPVQQSDDRKPISQLSTSDTGKEFIRGWEGVLRDTSGQRVLYYDDSKNFCTVGWGHLIAEKSCSEMGFISRVSSIPQTEGLALFDQDVELHEARVKAKINVPLHQHEFDALVSLAFNLGSLTKTPKLCQKLNERDYAGAPSEFLDIENRSRRRSEFDLFKTAVYNWRH